jgi:CRP/FNR family nitrogen fixation transcriptional regulator
MITQAKFPVSTRGSLSVQHVAPISTGAQHPVFDRPQLAPVTMPYDRNAEIFGQEEKATYIYRVVSGAVRTYRILSDGRRQVCDFHMPGEVFGLEAGEQHTCSAEAIGPTVIQAVRRSTIVALSKDDGEVARSLWAITAQELRRVQEHALLLIKSAQERVAAFLLEMAKRLTNSNTFELPMSRQDIADYLGLTIETVSRTLTQLECSSTIALPASRRVVLRDARALRALNS